MLMGKNGRILVVANLSSTVLPLLTILTVDKLILLFFVHSYFHLIEIRQLRRFDCPDSISSIIHTNHEFSHYCTVCPVYIRKLQVWALSSGVFMSVKNRFVTFCHTLHSAKIIAMYRTQFLYLQGNNEGGKLFRNVGTHLANCEVT